MAIERKTANDLVGSLTRHRERFERELHRGRALSYFALVVESSLADFVHGKISQSDEAESGNPEPFGVFNPVFAAGILL